MNDNPRMFYATTDMKQNTVKKFGPIAVSRIFSTVNSGAILTYGLTIYLGFGCALALQFHKELTP